MRPPSTGMRLLPGALLAAVAACAPASSADRSSSDAAVGNDAAVGDDAGPGTTQGSPCSGVVVYLPPIVSVVSATTGSPICEPTFAVVEWPDAGPVPPDGGDPILCDGSPVGCPSAPHDGGVGPCQYALQGLIAGGSFGPTDVATFTIAVSKPGFESVIVPDVSTGVIVCPAPNKPASQLTVQLSPLDGDTADGWGP
jgi:hypothetical protein